MTREYPATRKAHVEPLREGDGKASSLVEKVSSWIATRIIEGTFRPGEPLSEQWLVEQVGASRTPVREALRGLARDGLVRLVPGRGAFVADVTEREVSEIYQCRMQLEGLAARLAAERMAPEALATFRHLASAMQEAVDRDDHGAYFQLNLAFGRLKRQVADNSVLTSLLSSLGLRVTRLRYLSMQLPSRLAVSARLHLELVEAFERRDGEAAERINRELISGAHDALLRYYFGSAQRAPVLRDEISDFLAGPRRA